MSADSKTDLTANDAPVVLVTGASAGFGQATAKLLAARGFRVFGTSRKPKSDQPDFEWIVMDVDDDASVAAGIAAVLDRVGRIDVVLNNAGISIVGSVEDMTIDEAKRQLETNLFGVARVARAVLPSMRGRGGGKIINVSSIGGLISLPFQAYYCVSKFGVEALTEALRMELLPFGIKVCCIEPGDFKTDMTDNRMFAAAAHSPAYGTQMKKTVDSYSNDERNGADPASFAQLVLKLIGEKDPKPRYMVGDVGQKAGGLLKRVMSARLFEKLMLQHCRIER
jgi:NAD(P)-dependent dehydrogenase (short-subunit alcohol dehydrogenase family)